MYKVGDLVRDKNTKGIYKIKENEIGFATEERIYTIDYNLGIRYEKDLEPATHLTTKEFIKLVEYMGYKVEEEQGELSLFRNGDPVFTVRIHENSITVRIHENSMLVDGYDVIDKGNNILTIVDLYLNTPLELREEKEQLYTLELPNNDGENFKYYNYNCEDDNQYYFGDITNDTLYQTHFTQKEIDELPNQELIKALIKKEVEEIDNEK